MGPGPGWSQESPGRWGHSSLGSPWQDRPGGAAKRARESLPGLRFRSQSSCLDVVSWACRPGGGGSLPDPPDVRGLASPASPCTHGLFPGVVPGPATPCGFPVLLPFPGGIIPPWPGRAPSCHRVTEMYHGDGGKHGRQPGRGGAWRGRGPWGLLRPRTTHWAA